MRWGIPLWMVVALWAGGCARYELGEEVLQGSMAVTLTALEHRHACLRSPYRRYLDGRPSYLLSVRLRNVGESVLTYDPRHGRPTVTDNDYVNIYSIDRELLRGVVYEPETRVEGQVTEAITLAPGESLDDVFVFDVAPPSTRSSSPSFASTKRAPSL